MLLYSHSVWFAKRISIDPAASSNSKVRNFSINVIHQMVACLDIFRLWLTILLIIPIPDFFCQNIPRSKPFFE